MLSAEAVLLFFYFVAMNNSTPASRIARSFRIAVADCSAEMGIYAKCMTANLDNIEKGRCQREFESFKQCFRKVIVQSFNKYHSNVELIKAVYSRQNQRGKHKLIPKKRNKMLQACIFINVHINYD